MGDVSKQVELSPIKRALVQQRELKATLEKLENAKTEPLAIIGIGCRFPGDIRNLHSFWELLRNGEEAISEIPIDRWNNEEMYDPDFEAPGKVATRCGGFIQDLYAFDPHFFGISPREAFSMDPQQRLLLEVCWESLESAGIAPGSLVGSPTGVFVGIATGDYELMGSRSVALDEIDAYTSIGTAESVASGRVSYLFGLTGPSISVNTACSSSLVAVHLACQSLRLRECDVALASGVNAVLAVEHSISLSKAGMMAADGRCKTFDASADGFVRAEGCGAIVLKRYGDAVADGDNILALIRGSAVNHDGKSNGLTAPNGPAQEAVIKAALKNGNVDQRHVSYVETHGTGTELGDPIEVQALAAAYGEGRDTATPLMLGSLKTNLGHMESAAGIGSLVKVVLAMQNKEIPAHINFNEPSPHIPWNKIPVTVVTEATSWQEKHGTRLAGISSFGFSGTNAHVIAEQAPERVSVTPQRERPLHLCCVSAQTDVAMRELAASFIDRLENVDEDRVADFCFTANSGRDHQKFRLAAIGETPNQLAAGLRDYVENENSQTIQAGEAVASADSNVVFLFSGQGDQYFGMGRELYADHPVFRDAIDRCDVLMKPYLGHSLVEILYRDESLGEMLNQTAVTQPALFSVQYALAEMWRSWGVIPAAVAGHSVGEIAAACVAGVMSLEDAAMLVAERGQLTQKIQLDGAMLTVRASEAKIASMINAHSRQVSTAAINGPDNIVLSGPRAELVAVAAEIEAAGIDTRILPGSHAFHSPFMAPVRDALKSIVSKLKLSEPDIDFVSTVTGQAIGGQELTNPEYWANHATVPVQFSDAMQSLRKLRYRFFLEIGPHTTIVGMGAACHDDYGSWLPSLRKGCSDWQRILESLGSLYVKGVDVCWRDFDSAYSRRTMCLPTYPFQHEQYRIESSAGAGQRMQDKDAIWQMVTRAASHQASQVPLDLRLDTYADKWHCLDELTTAYVRDALHGLGALEADGTPLSVDALIADMGVELKYRDLMSVWLERLANAGLLARASDNFVAVHNLPAADLESKIEKARSALGDIPVLMQYIEGCGRHIVPVLRGEANAVETLFPDGSFEIAEFLYQGWGLARYFNNIVGRAIESIVAASGTAQLRVLEVGAGTGGTTSSVLSMLPADRTEYLFTDLSDVFLNRAGEKFADYPFVQYGILDIGKDPAEQGYAPGSFDIVIAANSLHATPDLSETLANARSLLVGGGVLILYEVTQHLPWFETSVALIEGWQLYEDELRINNPLVTPEIWKAALTVRGFDSVASYPGDDSPAKVLGHHVILARATRDGRRAVPVSSAAVTSSNPGFPKEAPVSMLPGIAENSLVEKIRATARQDRPRLIVEFVRRQVMQVLRLDESHAPDRKDRLMDVGVDSLMAVELRKRISSGIGEREAIPSTLIFDYPTIEAIATFLLKVLGLQGNEDAAPENTIDTVAAQLTEMTEAEVENELLKRLDRR